MVSTLVQRLLALSLIVFAHLVLLVWLNQIPFAPVNSSVVLPVTLVVEKEPILTPIKTKPTVNSKTPKKNTRSSVQNVSSILIEQTAESALPLDEATPEPPSPEPAITPEPTLLSSPPPTASYLLDVVRIEPKLGNPYYGVGKITWRHENGHYAMQIDIGIDMLFTTVRLYNMQSEGRIDATGIKPYKTVENRRRRATATTKFDYDNQTIHFSANASQAPLLTGVQDRATILMQLASLGNADPTQFEAGKEISIQVAEDTEANIHQFVVDGQEELTTPLGQLMTWHIVRPPRSGVYSSRIDIWLAPELHWLPVQFRNSESNGAITTQTIRHITTG